MRNGHLMTSIVPIVALGTMLTAEWSVAEEGIEIRAARVCAGLAHLDLTAQGSLKIDNFSVQADNAKGTATIKKDGVDIATMDKLTYEKYSDCLFKMVSVLSGLK